MRRAQPLIPILLLLAVLPLYGANKTFTDLPAVSSVGGGDEFPTWQSSTAKKATANQIKTFVGGRSIYKLGSDYTNNSTTGTEITGLGPMTVAAAGTLHLDCRLVVQSAATTTSPKFGINYTGTATLFTAHARFPSEGVTAATGQLDDVANQTTGSVWAYAATTTETTSAPDLGPWTGVTTINANILMHLESVMTVSDTGDIEVWAGSEVASSQITVKAGSFCVITVL